MPLTDDPRWSCYRKRAFPTEALARRAATRAAVERNVSLNTYGCKHCGFWHIGRYGVGAA